MGTTSRLKTLGTDVLGPELFLLDHGCDRVPGSNFIAVWVGLVVEDVERKRAFYRDVLGFRELESGNGWVWFDMGEGRLFELLAHDASLPQYAQAGFTVAFDEFRFQLCQTTPGNLV